MKILDIPQSGSMAGTTSSRNRFGQYRRTRAIPVQPRTPKQTRNRASIAMGASAWRLLTDAQRTGWNDYAAQITRTNSLGQYYSPTGSQLFSGAAAINVAPVTDPPAALPEYVLGIESMTYVDSTPGPEALTVDIVATSANNTVLIDTSGPVSAGVTSAAGVRRWRSLPTTALNNFPSRFVMTADPIPILTEYKYLFPSPVAGQVIWFRFREIYVDPTTFTSITTKSWQTFRLVVV